MRAIRPLPEAGTPWPEERILENFELSAAELGRAVSGLPGEDAVSLPFVSEDLRRFLLQESALLPYRPARPTVGKDERTVYQDFELCMTFDAQSPFREFARALDRLTNAAVQHAGFDLDTPFSFNDLIVQRYMPGSGGITPHRDHVRYVGLVALVILAGDADFYLCGDRDGSDAKFIDSPEGCLLLMRGAGFAGLKTRPFHMLKNIRSFRVSFGLRHDTRPDEPV